MMLSKPMRLFYRRPLCLALTFGIAAWAICPRIPSPYKTVVATAFLSVAILSFVLHFFIEKKRALCKTVALICALVSLALFVFRFTVDPVRDTYTFDDTKTYDLTLRLESFTENDVSSPSYRVTITEISGNATNLAAEYTHYAQNEFREGDILKMRATLMPAELSHKASDLLSDGIGITIDGGTLKGSELSSKDAPHLKEKEPFFLTDDVKDVLMSVGDQKTGALLSAVFLGDTSELNAQDRIAFRRIGISHLVAVSGLHISLLICALERLLRLLRVPKTLRITLSLFLLFTYLALVGFTPSALRAGVMHLVVIFAFLRQGQNDSLTALALAAYAICLFSPATVYSIGFWLSVCATAGILILLDVRAAKAERETHRHFLLRAPLFLLRCVQDMLLISLGANAFVLPLSCMIFGSFSPIAPVTSLLLAPIFQLLLYGACLAPLLVWCPILLLPLKLLSGFALDLARAMASFDGVYVPAGGVLELLLSLLPLCLLLIFALALPHLRKTAILSLSLSFVIITGGLFLLNSARQSRDAVGFASFGHNEALATRSDGELAVYELKSTQSSDYSLNSMLMKRLGESKVDTYALTAYGENSESSLFSLIHTYFVESCLLPTPKTSEERILAEKLVKKLSDAGIAYRFYEPSAQTSLGNDDSFICYRTGKSPLIELTVRDKRIFYVDADEVANGSNSPDAFYATSRADVLILGDSGSDRAISLPYTSKSLRAVLLGSSKRAISLPAQNVEILCADYVAIYPLE